MDRLAKLKFDHKNEPINVTPYPNENNETGHTHIRTPKHDITRSLALIKIVL